MNLSFFDDFTINEVVTEHSDVGRTDLGKPSYTKLLDISRNYWLSQGVEDWDIVIEKEDSDEGK